MQQNKEQHGSAIKEGYGYKFFVLQLEIKRHVEIKEDYNRINAWTRNS